MIIKCETCGKDFNKKPSQIKKSKKHFCSFECTKTSVIIKCNFCGKEIKLQPWQIKSRSNNYCSRECLANSRRLGDTKQCLFCKKDIYRNLSLLKSNSTGEFFCSHGCRSKYQRIAYKVKCVVCGTEFDKCPAEQKRYPVHCCSLKCRNKYNDKRLVSHCKTCNKKIERPPSLVNGRTNVFCSKECHDKFQDTAVIVKCDNCGEEVKKSPSAMGPDLRHHFCSIDCFSKFSFDDNYVELEFEKMIQSLGVIYLRNDRKTLFGDKGWPLELDFYFPDLKYAVEINGSSHYNPIFGEDALASQKSRDRRKRKLCKELGIFLRSIKPGNCKVETYLPRYKRVVWEIKQRMAKMVQDH